MTSKEVEQVRTRLKGFHGRYDEIRRASGLSYSWVTKFAQGLVKNPTMRTLTCLQAAMTTLEAPDKP